MIDDSMTAVKARLMVWLTSPAMATLVLEITSSYGRPQAPPAVIYAQERVVPPEAFPAGELLGISSQPVGDSSVQEYHHTVDVLWTVAGDDEATIVRHAEALVLATRRLSFRQILPLPGGVGAAVIPGPEDYGPLLQSGGRTAQPLVKAARIRLVIPTMA